eukprot:669723-Rhodomonas_salina.3
MMVLPLENDGVAIHHSLMINMPTHVHGRMPLTSMGAGRGLRALARQLTPGQARMHLCVEPSSHMRAFVTHACIASW